MAHKPTDEQQAILEAFPTGDNLVIEAGAGTGKTSTLKMLAEQNPGKRGLYLAYNRAIKEDAARTFPTSVTCMTSHGMAYKPVGLRYKHRINGGRVPAPKAARILRINEPLKLGTTLLQPTSLARIITDTVGRFCHSADAEVSYRHVPVLNGLEDRPSRDALAQFVLPYARKAWEDLTRADGQLHYTHDCYLKIFQLSGPRLDYDYLLVDEAQDLNPVVKAIVEAQTGTQVALVGDRNQAIYAWRNAVDAMENAAGKRLWLSQSFRFGPAIAGEANKWLDILGADMRLTGYDKVPSVVGPLQTADAVLCRTNAVALQRVMRALDNGVRVGLVGGGKDIQALARAAADLMAGRGTDHPELMAFTSWFEVQEYAENDSAGSDLKVLVSMVDKHGPDTLISAMDRLTDERYAKMLVSTAHRAKGREWDSVQVADDFREPKPSEDNPSPRIERADAMLAYVTVTRAKRHLDRSGLAWVDGWVSGVSPKPYDPRAWEVEAILADVADRRPANEADAEPVVVDEPASLVTADSAEPVLSWTADPCPTCGYLVDKHGVCVDCITTPAPAPEAPAAPGAPFAIDEKVRYVGKDHAVALTVEEIWPIGGGSWSCHLREPHGRMQRAVPAEWLEAMPQQAGALPLFVVEAPAPMAPAVVVPVVVAHCRRCGSSRCLCSSAEKRRWLALTGATTAEAVTDAITAYTGAVAGRAG